MVAGMLAALLSTPGAATAAPTPTPPPAAQVAAPPTPQPPARPYHRTERKESELHRKLRGKRPDFGPDDPVSHAWAGRKISDEEYLRLAVQRIAEPGKLPQEYRAEGGLSESAGLALGHAMSLRDRKATDANSAIDKQLSVVATQSAGASTGWTDCEPMSWSYLLHVFDCKRSYILHSKVFNIFYSISGVNGFTGVPAVDSNTNGVPDAIDEFIDDLSTAWNTYMSWGYEFPGDYVSVYFGFNENQNPGLTLPFGDHLFDDTEGSIILLPSDPGADRYRYLAYHEFFHVMQYHFIPTLNLLLDLPSVNWWMEASAEWATHRMFNLTAPTAPGWDTYANGLPLFLSEPYKAINSSTWPWEPFKRQYGAFILAQYLTEQTDVNFVLHTWESMGITRLPLEAIQDVVEDYGLDMEKALLGFWVANYRLNVDAPDLSRYLGSPVGYRDPDAQILWAVRLQDNRPARAAEHTLLVGGSTNGTTAIYPGGAAYLEITGPSTTQSVLTMHLTQGSPDADLRYLLVSWPTGPGGPSDTPSHWSRSTGDGDISISLEPGEVATLIAVRTDLMGNAGDADDALIPINWSASVAQGGPRPTSTLNTMWSNRSASAGCADWSGGDAVQSTPLPEGGRAWFFSDTFLGDPSKQSPGTEVSYLRNSIVVQQGSTLRTITGGRTCQETNTNADDWDRYAKTPAGEGAQYWTGDAKLLTDAIGVPDLVKFYYEGVGDENTRAAYARFSHTDLLNTNTANVVPTRLQDCFVRQGYPVIWGASLLDQAGMTYIYGWEADAASADKTLYLARTASTADPADQTRWQYFAGTAADGSAQWSPSCSASTPLQPKSEVDFSVVYLNERFWLVRHTPASQAPGKIVAMPATTPWGFGSDQVDLYTPPETKTNPRYSSVYGARVHVNALPDRSRVVISYTVSTSATDLTCWIRGSSFPDIYQPRFFDVPTSAFFSKNT
ncbi:hypothetical protein Misp03_16170 [Microbispora sp. NBRC 16548]|nr:hypothetical protein Misp03_16170 [Microbispora sp. NBRC 16548]